MKRLAGVALVVAALLTSAAGEAPAHAATYTGVVRYGPFTIPAATDAGPGMVPNRLMVAVRRPCLDCYITSFQPDLVYGDGTAATMATGPMLHHAVFASRYLQLRVTFRPGWESVRPLKPVWLDIDQCGDSEYPIPAGFSDSHWDWNVNVAGQVVAMIGHVHGHGIAVEATNESQGGTSICRSTATPDPIDAHRVLAMSTCVGDPLTTVNAGEVVRLHSEYQSTHAADDVMGIMLAYIRRS